MPTLKNEIAVLLSWKYPKSEMGYCVEVATQILKAVKDNLPKKKDDEILCGVRNYFQDGYNECLDDIISLLTV